MKIISSKGIHARHKQRFPKTKYVEHDDAPYRDVWRKYSLLDRWHYEGWYEPELDRPLGIPTDSLAAFAEANGFEIRPRWVEVLK